MLQAAKLGANRYVFCGNQLPNVLGLLNLLYGEAGGRIKFGEFVLDEKAYCVHYFVALQRAIWWTERIDRARHSKRRPAAVG